MTTRKLDNWIKTYLAYTNESESPEVYHKWCAISAIAGAMRRRSFFDMGYFSLYPNMYIVLVGPPGRCKKSTAMRTGRDFLDKVPGVSFTTDSVTRERLIMDLTQSFVDGHSSMTAYSSEFATLLTSSGMDMVVFLTDIFDSPTEWTHKTKVGGTNKIKAPWLNMLAATTPDWISKAMPLDTVGIGLTSRIVFVYQDTPRVRDPFPKLSKEQVMLRELLEHDLVQMSQITGEYTMSPEADVLFREWYKTRVEMPNPSDDSRLDGYYERKPTHLIKLAMIVSASFTDELSISAEVLTLAMGLLEEAETLMPRVFANVGKNPLNVDMENALAMIIAAGPEGLPTSKIAERLKHSVRKDELNEVLEMLIMMNQIKLAGNRYYSMI